VAGDTTLDSYVATGPVSGIVIVHRGRIVYERYPRMDPSDRHVLMSVTKVFPGTMIGILEQQRLVDLRVPVDEVLEELRGSGWSGVRIDDVLNMRSGIDCLEDDPGAYTDPDHPYYRFEATLGWRPTLGDGASTYDFVAALPARRPAGEAYEYTGVNTFVLSWVIERVTGMPFAEALGDMIWSRVGVERSARLTLSEAGAPASHGGLSTTLRDLARFGMLFTPSRRSVADADVLGPRHLAQIRSSRRTLPDAGTDESPEYVRMAYGPAFPPPSRQWNFAMSDGDLFKGGFGGQGLYVSPARDVSIAFAGIPRDDGSVSLLRWYSRRVATELFGRRA
jgi:CubicO group peptidase (beta-lactamase class C family)